MRKICIALIAVLTVFVSPTPQYAVETYSVWLKANPAAIVADSTSSTTISAEVQDSSGRPVPDGTRVDFTTSLGIIERSANTEAGVARVRLESGNTQGTAIVSAVVANGFAVGRLNVAFLAPGTEMFDESFISVESDSYLGYDSDRQIVDAAGGVRIFSRGFTIEADKAQIGVRNNILRATGRSGRDIIISRGEKKILASALVYDFTSMNGVLLTPAEDGAKRMLFRSTDFFVEPDKDPSATITFDFEPIADSQMFIRAKSVLIRPGKEVKLKRARFYMEGDKVLSMPLHVVPLNSKMGGMDRVFTYSTDGLRMDVPFYYSLSAHGTGALRIKHSEPTQWGYYAGRSGWQADLVQDYNYGSTEGKFLLNRITSSDWGASWSNRFEFDNNSQLYSYIDFPAHKDLYGTMDYRRSFKDFTVAMYLRGNKLQNHDGRYSSYLGLQTKQKPLIGNAVTYGLSTRVGYDNQFTTSDKINRNVGLQLYGKPIMFGSSASLNTSVSVLREWGGGTDGTSIYGNAGFFKSLGMLGQMGLNYSYGWSNASSGFSSQRLSADVTLRPSTKWDARLYATYGLDDHSTSAFGEFNYSFVSTWRLGIMANYQSITGLQNFAHSDYDLVLSKLVGSQYARLVWSHSQNRFRLEFSPINF